MRLLRFWCCLLLRLFTASSSRGSGWTNTAFGALEIHSLLCCVGVNQFNGIVVHSVRVGLELILQGVVVFWLLGQWARRNVWNSSGHLKNGMPYNRSWIRSSLTWESTERKWLGKCSPCYLSMFRCVTEPFSSPCPHSQLVHFHLYLKLVFSTS